MTNEDRPLQIAIFSSPENMRKLEEIRTNNLKLAGLLPGPAAAGQPIAVVWLSMSVHGNEPSGSECSMELAYRLATQSDPEIKEWLKNTVVIIDPSLNPDGYDRYTHWYRMVSNKFKTPQAASREHREPWPGGRTNHYYYDLNRDWAWATQVETQQRLTVYQSWLPHIHADLHEQYIDNPYYFAPAAEPMHDYINAWQRDFQTEIGKNHARYFDQHGWLYFTREVFDLFYPSYGDTYPMFNGAIGMTYEQAGHGSAGRAIETSSGDTLTLYDRIEHHLTTSLSTIEMASKNAARVVDNFELYYKKSQTNPEGLYKSFVIPVANNDRNKINALCALLDRHQIKYGIAGDAHNKVNGMNYNTGKDTVFSIDRRDLIVSAHQPHGVLVQVLFEPAPNLSDSLTYDITAWAMPHAYGLNAYALKQRMEPKEAASMYVARPQPVVERPYAYCVHRSGLAESKFLAQLLLKDIRVRYATEPFDLADQHFMSGALVITRGDNSRSDAHFDALVAEIAKETNVPLYPIFSGFATKGHDLGSESFELISKPEVAVVYGEGVDDNSYGHAWFFFEQELNYPVASLTVEQLDGFHLDNYNTLVMPNGYYRINDNTREKLSEWMQRGGRIIAYENAVRAFAGKDGFVLKNKPEESADTTDKDPEPYQSRKRSMISEQLPGAVIKTHVDNTHPLAFGMASHYFTLKTGPSAYEIPEKGETPIWIGEDYLSFGFIGSSVKPRLEKSPVVSIQHVGQGELIYMVDNPLFRSFWQEGKALFANALFY